MNEIVSSRNAPATGIQLSPDTRSRFLFCQHTVGAPPDLTRNTIPRNVSTFISWR